MSESRDNLDISKLQKLGETPTHVQVTDGKVVREIPKETKTESQQSNRRLLTED